MRQGRVHVWMPDLSHPLGGTIRTSVVALPRLNGDGDRLEGQFVRVLNAGAVNSPLEPSGAVQPIPIGDAQPDPDGNFLFDPQHGGERLDKDLLVPEDVRRRYIEASHFGEVNTYFHLDKIAAYIDGLCRELGAPRLPPVTAKVNAHHAATEQNGARDGEWHDQRWRPFQGGHYRLPSWRYDISEPQPISAQGEIHLGPGRQGTERGALAQASGSPYLHNASHNAGTLYHEYGHHIHRHTADFRANGLREPDLQSNRKTATDEGTSDYWAATMLDTPHIWAWHRRHDDQVVHKRSLISRKTMADYDPGPEADPHANGTIWAAALWDLRSRLVAAAPDGARQTDLLVLKSLFLIGGRRGSDSTARSASRIREGFSVALAALLEADRELTDGRYSPDILETFGARGIHPLEAAVAAGKAYELTQ